MTNLALMDAKRLYRSAEFRDIALKLYSKDTLEAPDYWNIKDFDTVIEVFSKVINKNVDTTELEDSIKRIGNYNKQTEAFIKCALTTIVLNKDTPFPSDIGAWYPLITISNFGIKTAYTYNIGGFKSSGEICAIYGGKISNNGDKNTYPLSKGEICYDIVGTPFACASPEIAKHFSRYFGMSLFRAMFPRDYCIIRE